MMTSNKSDIKEFRPLKRETKSYRDAQYISDADRVKALRRSQFKKGR